MDICKQINLNSKIDYVSIYPHYMIFSNNISYMINGRVVDEYTNVEHMNIRKDLSKLFDTIKKYSTSEILYIKFDYDLTNDTISQMLENISLFLSKKQDLKF